MNAWPQPLPALRRRHLMTLAAAAACPPLAGCGGTPTGALPQVTDAPSAADEMVRQGLVGVVAGRIDADAAPSLGHAGLRRIDGADAVAEGDIFSIGSNTKAMAATAIATLVDEGLLSWTLRPAEVLPKAGMHPAYGAATLADLLNHRAGVLAFDGSADDEDRFIAALQADPGPLPQDLQGRRAHFARWLLAQPPVAGRMPGRDFAYSNAGYAVAAAMVEARTGQPFEQLFDRAVVQRLGIGGRWRMPSQIEGDAASQPAPHAGPRGAVRAFAADAETLAYESWLQVLAPAGWWSCDGAAYAHWLRGAMQALRGQGGWPAAVLPPVQAVPNKGYAMGWVGARGPDGRAVLLHSGHVGGFMAMAVVTQDGQRAVFALTNVGQMDDGGSWVLQAMGRVLAALMVA